MDILTQLIPRAPCATRAKPTVAPTILCVAETGNRSNVATKSQRQDPDSAATLPIISCSVLFTYGSVSMMPLRIVSDTLAPETAKIKDQYNPKVKTEQNGFTNIYTQINIALQS